MAQYTTFRAEWCSNRKRAQYISRTEESYSGNEVYHAGYDPWGRQTVTINTIGFFRGYTGHEMLSDWNLVNMNGRLYDPVLGRFLSSDNFVQLPDNSQSYNRYTYCLNNPLKYTDPDGELFGIDDGILFFTIAYGAWQGAFNASVSGKSIWKGALKGAAIGAISSIGTSAVGSVLGHTAQSLGTELLRSGLHGFLGGTASVLQGNSFLSGFAAGSLSSLAGSGVQALNLGSLATLGSSIGGGALGAYITGGNVLDGMQIGLNVGLHNHLGGRKTIDPDGLTNIELDEVSVTAPRLSIYSPIASTLSIISSAYLLSSTTSEYEYIGTNGRFYYQNIKTNQHFKGNQHIKVHSMKNVSKSLRKIGRRYNRLSIFTRGVEAYTADGYQFGTNTERFSVVVAGETIGGQLGGYSGGYLGGMAGGYLGLGVASIPSATVGAVSGKVA